VLAEDSLSVCVSSDLDEKKETWINGKALPALHLTFFRSRSTLPPSASSGLEIDYFSAPAAAAASVFTVALARG
jgi:hypothetical protein